MSNPRSYATRPEVVVQKPKSKTVLIAGGAGFVVGGVTGCAVWKKHRVWGFILGAMIGGTTGSVVGYLVDK